MALLDSYDGFIFDYGKVLVTDQPEAEREEMAAMVGLPRAEFEELYWRDRLDYDKASLTGLEYWQAIGHAAGKILTFDQVNSLISVDAASWMHYDEPMWDFANEMKALGKRVAILSNMPYDLGQILKLTTQRFAMFHHVTLSYEVKSVKPEAAIYEECRDGIATPPKRTIFFDDKLVNVRGAEMVGMDAIEFLDRDAVLAKLRGS